MIGFLKHPRRAERQLRVLVPAVFLTVVLAAAGCTSPPDPPAKVTTAPLSENTAASVTFPGTSNAEAKVAPREATPEMISALPAPSAHLAEVAEFTLTKGDFPDSGAQVSFTRKTAPPVGAFSVIVHWNEQSREWEPVQTEQSEDSLTFTATVEHFSAYSLLDLYNDLKTIYNNTQLEWGVDPDEDAKHRLANGLGEWIGVTAPAPTCSDKPRPGWADVVGPESITNIVRWCASGSPRNEGNLVVRVTVNRSYGGYFKTSGNPVVAMQGASDHTDGGVPYAGESSAAGNIVQKGYIDWKAIGVMMNEAGLITTAESDPGNPYPVMSYGTYEFEFTKTALLETWPDIEANNKKLIAFETNPIFSLAGVVNSLIDYGAASHKGGGALGNVVLALQVNDCMRSYNLFPFEGWDEVDGGEVLAVVNCASSLGSEKLNEWSDKLGLEDRVDSNGKPWRDKLQPAFDGASKLFKFVAKAGIAVTIGTAANDYVLSTDSDRRLGFAPGQDYETIFGAAPWRSYSTPDRRHKFMVPKGWEVVPGKPVEGLKGQNLSVVNEKGEEMSTYQTGWTQAMGQAVFMGEKDVRNLSDAAVPGLTPVLENTENRFLYQAANQGAGWSAFMGVHSFLKSDTERAWTRGFDIEKSGQTTIGGAFGRNFNDSTVLTDVDSSIDGYSRYVAYSNTDEYAILWTMLTSLSDNEQ